MPLSCTIPGYNQQSRHYGEHNAGAVGGDEPLACQQPFNTLPKLPTDAKQDLRPNFHLSGSIVERVLLIPISVPPLVGNSHGVQHSDAGLKHFPSPGKIQSTRRGNRSENSKRTSKLRGTLPLFPFSKTACANDLSCDAGPTVEISIPFSPGPPESDRPWMA